MMVRGEQVVMGEGGLGFGPCQPHEGQLKLQKWSLVYRRLLQYTKHWNILSLIYRY